MKTTEEIIKNILRKDRNKAKKILCEDFANAIKNQMEICKKDYKQTEKNKFNEGYYKGFTNACTYFLSWLK